ncbi:methyltransferase domain-containing protein [Marinicauda algicola]|uniref:Methyltransferase domain-containing protein n=1 Tax=Marinicauda algicola TaxID=2029849 RepID=A0A4S2H4L1_9PROT|nr:methyltransferase domain-containing protein [Marinicauda algicola]TGY90232.1 methyltransferase domain-containing protein [Marinicauda algicola]
MTETHPASPAPRQPAEAAAGGPPVLFDRTLLKRRRERAAGEFDAFDFLHARAAEDLVDRLTAVTRDFDTCLMLGGGGALGRALKARPDAAGKLGRVIEADLSPALAARSAWSGVALDEEHLPIAEESVDLVLSCLSLHWTNDLVGALIQINRALKPDGFFACALFGGATLTELRQSLMAAEGELKGGVSPRVSPFADTVDMAGLLARAGFAMPVSDVDRVKARYPNAFALMRDLRKMGETSALKDRPRTPVAKSFFVRTAEIYAETFAEADGKMPATFEIIHAAGWAPHPDQPKPKRPGSAQVRLAEALGVSERSAGEKAGG